jgi:predicted nucleic acid-binding protein
VSGIVADTSVWIEHFGGQRVSDLEDGLAQALVVLPPIVVAELMSGAHTARERSILGDLFLEIPIHETPLDHWIRVGTLRRRLRSKGLSVSTPDAHVAQCALDRDAVLLSRDAIFRRVAGHTQLRLR